MASYTEHFNPFVWIKTGEGADRTITSEQLRGYVTDETGTGVVVFNNGPTLIAPALGTPASGVATNLTGTAAGLTAGNVTTNANLTGPITSTGNATAIASQTGTGTKFVMDTSPTIITPTIASLTNAQHNHTNAAGGGQITTAALSDFVVWTSPTFDAADFTASGTMTWTLAAGDVATYAYLRIGKAMLIAFYLATTSVGGTPSTALRIKVPTGATIAKTMASQFAYNDNGAARVVGTIFAAAGVTYLELYKIDVSNWTAAANTTQVQGQIFIEIQ